MNEGAARYIAVCSALGLVLGVLPGFVHGPVAEKISLFQLDGATAVKAWWLARLLVGFYVGVFAYPRAWFLRGPLCGLLSLLPLTVVSLSIPTCGAPCMAMNLSTAATVGFAAGGLAFAITGRSSVLG